MAQRSEIEAQIEARFEAQIEAQFEAQFEADLARLLGLDRLPDYGSNGLQVEVATAYSLAPPFIDIDNPA